MRTPIFIDNMNPGGADATSEHANVAHVHHPSKFFDKFFASIYISVFYVANFFRHNPQRLLATAQAMHQHRELVERRAANDGAEAHAVLSQHAVGGGLAEEGVVRDNAWPARGSGRIRAAGRRS